MASARILVATAMLLACAALARAQAVDPTAMARKHYEAGRALYDLGKYSEAAAEFSTGYDLTKKPLFLVNLGQCYRRLDDLDKARQMYERYLREAPPEEAERAQAETVLAEINRQISERPPASASSSPATPALTATASAEPPARSSFLKRHWWILPAGAVVVGAVVGVGVYYGTHRDPCAGSSLACWDVTKSP